jgi:2-polyprenyl-3-methyl-5-hydroxy-6-metoxy-1,4-benzoquinol methylase
MPYSDEENRDWVSSKIEEIYPKTILDVGPGAGAYGKLIKKTYPNITVDAVEVWEPYLNKFKLHSVYDRLYVRDAREHTNYTYDLVIFGDVLEHMTKEDAIALWNRVKEQAKYALISIPIVHYPQSESEDNPYEVHVKDDWTNDEVLLTFSSIIDYKVFNITGSYLAKFN